MVVLGGMTGVVGLACVVRVRGVGSGVVLLVVLGGVVVVVRVFFINPIRASEVDPGCIDFKPGEQPIHNTLLREGPSP